MIEFVLLWGRTFLARLTTTSESEVAPIEKKLNRFSGNFSFIENFFSPHQLVGYIPSMRLYPVFLSLENAHVLVAGAGRVGRRKIAGLLEARAGAVLVFDPGLPPQTRAELETTPHVRVFCRVVTAEDLAGMRLVFATTNDAAENVRIAALCAADGIPVNVADDPARSDFHVPAVARTDELTAAFSTGGNSPALAARIRDEAADWLESAYGPLLVFMSRLRPLVLVESRPAEENGELFRAIVRSGLGEAMAAGQWPLARQIAAALLPESLRGYIEELFHGVG